MKENGFFKTTAVFALAFLLLTAIGGCGRQISAAETAAPVLTAAPVSPAEPEAVIVVGRQDGERFEETILLEGMEETVRYEHVRNDTIGVELDYDYERFARHREAGRECFVSIYDLPAAPENYLEVTYSPQDADTAAASVRKALSQEFELLEHVRELDRAGSCIYIEASELKGTGRMADQLQAVYIIPAADGCRIAAAHYSIEGAEGFGRRFHYMMNTLAALPRQAEGLSDEQALAAVQNYCYARDPDLKNAVNAGEYPVYWDVSSSGEQQAVVLFRSYTGAQIRYYIDRVTGDAYVTEFVSGITDGEQRTEESFNARDYLTGQDASSGAPLPIEGTWQSASMGYEADGSLYPEYYVRFTDTEICYGHLNGGEFIADHADRILSLAKTAAGGIRIQAEASNGVRYTYQTCESDPNVLEYFETWREEDFPEMYRGGASLFRSS